jgi:hypothetical protein
MDKANIQDLFNGANEEGDLSNESMAMIHDLDLGVDIQAAMGIPAIDSKTSEVILLTFLVDDSGSIAAARNEDNIRMGYNLILDSLLATKQKDGVYVHTRYLNGKILHPYMELTSAPKLDTSNYWADGWTPLYDQTAAILATVYAKTREYSLNGITARSVTVIITDGNDQGSRKYDANDIKPLVDDMLKDEVHIIAAMGIDDGGTDFNTVFTRMGLNPKWILTPNNSEHEIRQAFRTVSQSAVRASQTAANFQATAAGGFGNNP